ncbi:MAG: type IV pilus modification PilV family protein [Gemmatimonadales bacterium]
MQARGGFTLIEVLVAMVLLAGVLLVFGSATSRSVTVVTTSTQQAGAIQLVEDRIDQVRMYPNYTLLDSLYAKTEASLPGWPGFQRVTTMVRTTSGGNDYKMVTVTVTGPGLKAPVARTVTIAAP